MTPSLNVKQIQKIFDESPCISFMQLNVISIDPVLEKIVVRMPWRSEFEKRSGTKQFHNGVVFALIDIVGDFAIARKKGGIVPTINFRIDFINPAIGKYLIATATIRKLEPFIGVVDVEAHDDKGTLCAIGRGAYSAILG